MNTLRIVLQYNYHYTLEIVCSIQSLLTKSRNWHALEKEAQPPHMTYIPHHIDF